MSTKFVSLLSTAALLAAAALPASATVQFSVQNYTTNSLTFSVTGKMPTTAPTTLADGPSELDILFTGDLFADVYGFTKNTLTALPLAGAGGLNGGNTGNYDLAWDFSWLYFANNLTGLSGTGAPVTLTWQGASYLNTLGTGTIDLYWGNLKAGPDAAGKRNLLLGSVKIAGGKIVGNDVPEPASIALFGICAGALGLARRRRQRRG